MAIHANTLRIGDRCSLPVLARGPSHGERPKRFHEALILEILRSNDGSFIAEVQMDGDQQGGIRHYRWTADVTLMTWRDGHCGAPACDRHIRDLDGGYICSDHWPAQLAAIA